MRRLPLFVLALLVMLCFFVIAFSPDVQADHHYGDYGCSSGYGYAEEYVEYGCSESAAAYGCAGAARERLFSRRPVRRIVGAPFRVIREARFAPSRRFGCGG